MQHAPIKQFDDEKVSALAAAEQQLREEITRLQRENKMLSIALSETQRIADRDMLTPLYNRRYFLSALHRRIANNEESDDRAALVYVDVDGLKSINDRFGHSVGDLLLIEIAERLNAAMRRDDVLARIGGDEFGMLLDQVNLNQAKAFVRRLKGMIEDAPMIHEGVTIPLSAAFGLCIVDPGHSAEELLGMADSDMYRSKNRSA